MNIPLLKVKELETMVTNMSFLLPSLTPFFSFDSDLKNIKTSEEELQLSLTDPGTSGLQLSSLDPDHQKRL
jgi:hypothetical protein